LEQQNCFFEDRQVWRPKVSQKSLTSGYSSFFFFSVLYLTAALSFSHLSSLSFSLSLSLSISREENSTIQCDSAAVCSRKTNQKLFLHHLTYPYSSFGFVGDG